MPINAYFHGHGRKVMADMQSRYGPDKGMRVFYATANKRGMKPGSKHVTGQHRGAAIRRRLKKRKHA